MSNRVTVSDAQPKEPPAVLRVAPSLSPPVLVSSDRTYAMQFNPADRSFTLSDGRVISELDAAKYRDGVFITPRRAVRAMEAELAGWSDISLDPTGKIIGLPPGSKSSGKLQEIP
jgi:hypothetical protein